MCVHTQTAGALQGVCVFSFCAGGLSYFSVLFSADFWGGLFHMALLQLPLNLLFGVTTLTLTLVSQAAATPTHTHPHTQTQKIQWVCVGVVGWCVVQVGIGLLPVCLVGVVFIALGGAFAFVYRAMQMALLNGLDRHHTYHVRE